MFFIKTVLILIIFVFQWKGSTGDGLCGDWDSYKDEKCFHLYNNVGQQTYEAAKDVCSKDNSSLVTIHSSEEQEFITKLVFDTNHVVDEVWIGAHKVGDKFKWEGEDGDITQFTNWADKNPTNLTNLDCVQMLPKSDTSTKGKWDNESCTKKNLVICQKLQIWTSALIQQTLLKERKQLEEILNELKDQKSVIDKQKETIETLKKSIVDTIPVGFTYVQLPKDKAPAEIWPNLKWQEVSSTYAGVFFRVAGGSAAAFGNIQEEDTPRLTRVHITDATAYKDQGDPIAKGGFGKVKMGSTGAPWYFQFDISNTEVRPRNMAIRVWKRIV